jgi:hypothetical protein
LQSPFRCEAAVRFDIEVVGAVAKLVFQAKVFADFAQTASAGSRRKRLIA